MRLITAVALTAMLVACVPPASRPVVGQWHAQQASVALELRADSTYVFGTSSGTYQVQDDLISFRDAATGTVTTYRMTTSETELVLTAQNGATMSFVRSQSGAGGVVAQGTGSATPAPSGDALAEQDGFQLQRAHVQTMIDVLQFVVNEPITAEESQQIVNAVTADFQANPAKTVSDAEALAKTFAQVRSVTNPIQIAMLRQAFVFAFHQAAQAQGEQSLPPFLQVMYGHVRVVAYDAANQLVLTDRDVDALIAYTSFLHQLRGGAAPVWSAELREQLIGSLQSQFPSLTVEQKRFYCGMTVYWNYLVYAWAQAVEQERQRMAMALLGAQAAAAAQPAQGYGAMQPQWQSYAPSGNDMDDSTYEALKNAMLYEHAGSMNVLDAIGGSEYNYDVVDAY